jgi:hypothetical protein
MDRQSSPFGSASQASPVCSPGLTASQKSSPPSLEEALKTLLKMRCEILYDFEDLQRPSANSCYPFHSGNGDLKHDFLLLSHQDNQSEKGRLRELLRTVYGTGTLQMAAESR